MTKRLSRDAKAWRKIAREFEKYANGAPKNKITESGLCLAAGRFKIVPPRRFDPVYQASGLGPTHWEKNSAWWWPLSRKGAEQRAIFAWLMSEVS